MTYEQNLLQFIRLIPLTQFHVEKTFIWIQNPEFRRLFLMRGEVSWQAHQEYFRKVLNDPSQIWYAIIVHDSHIGNCGISILSREKKECTFWVYIGDTSLRGKRIGTAATRLLIEKAFNVFEMSHIIIHVAAFNDQATRMYKTLGFTEIPLGNEEEWLNRGCEIIKMVLARDTP